MKKITYTVIALLIALILLFVFIKYSEDVKSVNDTININIDNNIGTTTNVIVDENIIATTTEIVAENPEGEADINKMNLYMTKWIWQKTVYNDDKVITPNKLGDFSISFNRDGNVFIDTDCNNMSGKFTNNKDKKISFNNMMSTLMYCEGSKEQDFSKMINEVDHYMFTTKGELILLLKNDSGSVVLR